MRKDNEVMKKVINGIGKETIKIGEGVFGDYCLWGFLYEPKISKELLKSKKNK